MPKLTNQNPRYCKHKASGQAVVKFGGKLYYLGPYGSKKSKAKYERLVEEWRTTGHNPSSIINHTVDLTIVELLARYMPFARQYYRKDGKPTNEVVNIKHAVQPLNELYGRQPVESFGPLALKALQRHLICRGLARTTINARIWIIKRIFAWAVSEELCPPSVSQALEKVAGLQAGRTQAKETTRVSPVSDADVQATIEHLPATVADMVKLQRLLGCRPGEICIMRPADIDRTQEVWLFRPKHFKTEHVEGSQRTIFVGPQAQLVLRPYLLRDAEAFCFSPVDAARKRSALLRGARKTPVQPSQRDRSIKHPRKFPGDAYTVHSYRRAIHRACRVAFPVPDDLPEEQHRKWRLSHQWNPNRLRHARATEIRRLFGLEAAQTVLDHARADVSQIYAERDLSLAARIMREVG